MTDASARRLTEDPGAVFDRERPRLVGLSYRLLGSIADAEDVVQVVGERWSRIDHASIDNPAAWLTTVASRVGIDRLRARRRDRADYVGPWLPEPVVTYDDQPAAAAELSDSLTTAFLVLLERLSPTERLVLLLADVFQQPFAAVALVIAKSEDATRQIAVRARRKVRSDDTRPITSPEQVRLATEFATAIAAGDEHRASALLADGVVLTSDGGPSRNAARRPVVGRDRVVRFLVNVTRRHLDLHGGRASVRPGWVNGSPGLVALVDNRPDSVFAFDTERVGDTGAAIGAIYVMLNPSKLAGASGAIDLR